MAGILSDILAKSTFADDFIVIYIEDSFIYTLIQVQVTLSTLTTAMIALLSNKIDTVIYGVFASDYLIHKKYKSLCQANVIILILLFNAISLFFSVKGLYGLIISILACILLLLARMLCCVLMAFENPRVLEEEIKKYVLENYKYDTVIFDDLFNIYNIKNDEDTDQSIAKNADLAMEIWTEMIKNDEGNKQ